MLKKLILLVVLLTVASCLAWTCPECGTENSDSAKYCTNCGTEKPKMKYCPECGAEFPEGARFCPVCGFDTLGETTGAATTTAATPAVTKSMGSFVIIPRCGYLTDFSDDFDFFGFGGQIGYNIGGLGGDLVIGVDVTFGHWKDDYPADDWGISGTEEASTFEIHLGTQGYLGRGTVRFTWGVYFGYLGFWYEDIYGGSTWEEIEGGAFCIRERIGAAFLFSDIIGAEVGIAIDEVIGDIGSAFAIYPALGIMLMF